MRGKRYPNMKLLLLLLTAMLVFGCAAGVTLAWLVTKTDSVVNTFTAGNINIDLVETPNFDSDDEDTVNDSWVGKMVPGTDITKDPKVTVAEGSESCYLFVKIDSKNGVVLSGQETSEDYITYAVAAGWENVPNKEDVYYRVVKANAAERRFAVLDGNKVHVLDTVTKNMLDNINQNNLPTLTFTAYAVQETGFATAEDAWDEAVKLG